RLRRRHAQPGESELQQAELPEGVVSERPARRHVHELHGLRRRRHDGHVLGAAAHADAGDTGGTPQRSVEGPVGPVTRDALYGRWTHAHEEDTSDSRVYRRPSHPFPPSRGRDSFELKPDGTMVEHAIGPTDRSVRREGTWELRLDGGL